MELIGVPVAASFGLHLSASFDPAPPAMPAWLPRPVPTHFLPPPTVALPIHF